MDIKSALSRNIIFVEGKGGVGKTCVAESIARALSQTKRVLLVTIEDPLRPPGELKALHPNLYSLNNEAMRAFEEYAGLKIGAPKLVRIFLQNRLMQYIAKAAPGVRELVLMGKLWYERTHYDHVVVDMPATGHGLTMFQSIRNWGRLFQSSPLAKDSSAMLETFSDPAQTAHVIVALPEEMPLVEGLELREHLLGIFPNSLIALVANRLFPLGEGKPAERGNPILIQASEYADRRAALESENLAVWKGHSFLRIPYYLPVIENNLANIVRQMTDAWNGVT